jgi:hypothetical protein
MIEFVLHSFTYFVGEGPCYRVWPAEILDVVLYDIPRYAIPRQEVGDRLSGHGKILYFTSFASVCRLPRVSELVRWKQNLLAQGVALIFKYARERGSGTYVHLVCHSEKHLPNFASRYRGYAFLACIEDACVLLLSSPGAHQDAACTIPQQPLMPVGQGEAFPPNHESQAPR